VFVLRVIVQQSLISLAEKELAEKSGISPTTINRLYNESWEQIDKRTMAKICEALGVDVGKLFEYVDK